MTDTETRTLELFKEYWAIDLSDRPEPMATPIAELRLDSLDVIEMAMAVEDEFKIEITDDELDPYVPGDKDGRTVADLVALIDAKITATAAAR